MSEGTSSFGALRALLQRPDEPFEQLCALLEAWPDPGELVRVALPYAIDHVRRWSRARPAPLRWRARLVRGERCPELAVCDVLDLRFVRDLILPPSHTELADILSSADELAGIRECRVDLLEPGWADAMPRLKRLSLFGDPDAGWPGALGDYISGVPGVSHIELHGVCPSERDLYLLDANAPSGALSGFVTTKLNGDELDPLLDWLCARAPYLQTLEVWGTRAGAGGPLKGEATMELFEALDAHPEEIRLESFAIRSSYDSCEPSLRLDERWGRLRRLALGASPNPEQLLNRLFRSQHLVNLEDIWLDHMASPLAQRFIESDISAELTRLRVHTSQRPEVRWPRLLSSPKLSDVRELGLFGYSGYDELRALGENRYISDLESLAATVPYDLTQDQWGELFASPGFAKIDRLSITGDDREGSLHGIMMALDRSLAMPSLEHLSISESHLTPLRLERRTSIKTLKLSECSGDTDPFTPMIEGSLCHTLEHLEVPEEWSGMKRVEDVLRSCRSLDVLVTCDGDEFEETIYGLKSLWESHAEAGVVGLRRTVHLDDTRNLDTRGSIFDWSPLDPL